jgi:hypothetical protein
MDDHIEPGIYRRELTEIQSNEVEVEAVNDEFSNPEKKDIGRDHFVIPEGKKCGISLLFVQFSDPKSRQETRLCIYNLAHRQQNN